MSAPVETPPPAQETIEIPKITFEEINNDPSPTPRPQPAPEPAPAPPPGQEPQPQPKPGANPLDDLFGEPEPTALATQPEPEPEPEPEPGQTPQWYRDALAKHKTEYEGRESSLRAELVAAQQRADQATQALENARKEASLIDPSQNPDVIKVREKLDYQVKSAAKQFSPKAAREFMSTGKDLVERYSALGDVYDEGYDDRYAALRKEVDKAYGADSDAVFRALPSIAETVSELKVTVQNAADGSEEALYSRQEAIHLDYAKRLDDIVASSLSYSEELASAGGFPPQNIVARLLDKSPEFKEQSKQINSLLKNSLIPPRPLSKSALASMTPDQAAKAQRDHVAAYQANYQKIWDIIPLAFHALYALPVTAAMLNEKNIEVKRLRGNAPPPPNGQEPQHQQQPTNEEGLRPISKDEIYS